MHVVAGVLLDPAGRVLLAQRPQGKHLAGMWEFPGGKIGPDEPHAAALRRELREELDVDADVGDRMYHTVHAYDDRTVELHFYRCTLKGEPRPLLGQQMRWVPRTELGLLGFPPADAELIEMLTKSDGNSRPLRSDLPERPR